MATIKVVREDLTDGPHRYRIEFWALAIIPVNAREKRLPGLSNLDARQRAPPSVPIHRGHVLIRGTS